MTALTAVATLAAVYAVGTAMHWGSAPQSAPARQTLATVMGDFSLSAVAAAAAVSCAARALSVHGRLRASWLLFAASALAAGLGNALWGWYGTVLHYPRPSQSSAAWMLLFFAPFAMAGTLVHHRGPATTFGWVKLSLDGVMIAGALFSAGWAIVLARTAGLGGRPPSDAAFALAYPVLDILMVSLVLALRLRSGRGDGVSMTVLIAGYSVIVAADGIWTLPAVRAGYTAGELLAAGWFLGYLLLAVAPWISELACDPRRGARHPIHVSLAGGARRALTLTGLLFPYVAGAICLGGIIGDGLSGDHRIEPAMLCTGATVLVALVVRQAVTLLDNSALTRELAVREDHFRSLVQGSSDVIMTVDPDGWLGYISPAVFHVFGYDPDSLAGSSLYGLIHPEDQIPVGRAVAGFLARDDAWASVQCRIRAVRTAASAAGGTDWRHAECTLTRHRGGLVFTCRDVSERIALQQQLAHNASHDSLTGLPNRALFAERLEQAVAWRSTATEPVAVLFLDLDWFKEVNDAGGHAAGDALLVEVAARLRGTVRAGDTVARLGGDEFAALVEAGPGGRDAGQVAARLHAVLIRPYRLPAGRFVIGACIGVAFWRPDVTAQDLMREADAAMYRAKAAGKGRIVVSDQPAARPLGPARQPPVTPPRPAPDQAETARPDIETAHRSA